MIFKVFSIFSRLSGRVAATKVVALRHQNELDNVLGRVYMHIGLFFLSILFHRKSCVFFNTRPVSDLGGAVGPEIDCVMHWAVVGTTGACCDMRLGVARPPGVTGVAYSTSIAHQYHQKSLKIIEIHWKPMEINENQWKSSKTNENTWFSLIFYDRAWSSTRLARRPGAASAAPDTQTHVTACPSSPYYRSMHHTVNLRTHSASKVADRPCVKKNTWFPMKKYA